MSHPAPDPNPAPDDLAMENARWRLAVLRELTEIGMGLARDLAEEAPPEGEAPLSVKRRDPADAFSRLSRAIRLTVSLHAKADEARRELQAGVTRERREAETRRRAERLGRVEILVMEAAEAERGFDGVESLAKELEERLDVHEEFWSDPEPPLRDVIERLCRFYGLSPDWSRWNGEGWAQEDGGPPWRHGWPWDGAGAQAAEPSAPARPDIALASAARALE